MLTTDELVSEIRALSDVEKLRLVDTILSDLHKLDAEINRVWAEEVRNRWAAYKGGHLSTISYEEMMARHLR
jgi:putative addiction module component (TIGR02574 family)